MKLFLATVLVLLCANCAEIREKRGLSGRSSLEESDMENGRISYDRDDGSAGSAISVGSNTTLDAEDQPETTTLKPVKVVESVDESVTAPLQNEETTVKNSFGKDVSLVFSIFLVFYV